MPSDFEKQLYGFHYDREERLKKMPPGYQPDKFKEKGFFKKKHFNIIVANLILVLILFPILTIYTRTTANRKSTADFNFLLNGYIFDNNMLISLTIQKKQDSTIDDTPLPFEATIFLSDDKEFYKKFFDIMPVSSDKEVVLRTSIPITDYKTYKNTIIHANIIYSDQSISLKSKIKNEK